MTLRRDHIVGGVLLAIAAAVFAFSGDLPAGTLGSPGPGMLPTISLGLIAAFALTLLAGAAQSPPFAETEWTDLSHAVSVTIAAAVAIAVYEYLGFVITMSGLIFCLLALIERLPLWRAALYAVAVPVGTKLLLGTVLKSPLPQSSFGWPFGF